MATFGKVLQWIAIAYGVVVVGVAIFVGIVVNQPASDASLVGVWLILVTLPISMLISVVVVDTEVDAMVFLLALVAGGLLQGAVLWFLGRLARNSARPKPPASL